MRNTTRLPPPGIQDLENFREMLRIILSRCKRCDLEKISACGKRGEVNLKSAYHNPIPLSSVDWTWENLRKYNGKYEKMWGKYEGIREKYAENLKESE